MTRHVTRVAFLRGRCYFLEVSAWKKGNAVPRRVLASTYHLVTPSHNSVTACDINCITIRADGAWLIIANTLLCSC